MPIRTTSRTLHFCRPFLLAGIADEQPAGTYTVETDEKLLQHVSVPAYRRVSTLIWLPPRPGSTGSSIWDPHRPRARPALRLLLRTTANTAMPLLLKHLSRLSDEVADAWAGISTGSTQSRFRR